MKYVIDLTKDRFECVDFSEGAIVDFFCPRILSESISFTIWGGTLWYSPKSWNRSPSTPNPLGWKDDVYVSGIGMISLTNVIGGEIKVYPYNNITASCSHVETAKNSDGSDLIFHQSWNMEKTQGADEYLWGCVIAWPYGYCILRLYSDDGKVEYEFDTDDAIDATEFLRDPKRYAYRETKGV